MRLSLFLVVLSMVGTARSQEFRVGAAAVDITPPVGTPMAGYFSERLSEGVHDPLFAKAIVLERNGKKAVMVSLDLISTPRKLIEKTREVIEAQTQIPGNSVMISATHAHTGPELQGWGAFGEAITGRNDLALTYSQALPTRIAEAVKKANEALQPARVAVARGEESAISFNRRFHMADGSVGWNPGKLNPRIIKPAGTIDPDVAVVYFETDNQARSPLATYVNHAVHLDNVGGVEFSGDMPATISELLGRFKGPEMVTVYTSGCCGDINHVNVRWSEPQKGHENAARMGVILAAEVLRAWPKLSAEPAGVLRVEQVKVKLPSAPITTRDVEASKVAIDNVKSRGKPLPFLEVVQAFKVQDVASRNSEPVEVEVQAITLGDKIAWVSLPGEIFVELGLTIKQDSPFPHTIIAELANGAVGYIPSRRAYGQGNYEVVCSPVAAGSGEILVDAAVTLLKKMHREAAAAPAP